MTYEKSIARVRLRGGRGFAGPVTLHENLLSYVYRSQTAYVDGSHNAHQNIDANVCVQVSVVTNLIKPPSYENVTTVTNSLTLPDLLI